MTKLFLLAAGVAAALVAGPVGAQTCPYPGNCPGVEVEGIELQPTPVPPEPGQAGPVVDGRQQLPVTGSDAAALAALGGVLVGGGVVLTWRSRRANAEV